MAGKRALMACPNHWQSTFQVGSHNLARELARRGWEVAYVADPISPFHLCRGLTRDLRQRLSAWWAGGGTDCDGRLWSCVPAAWLTPHNKPLLRGEWAHRNWHRLTWPGVRRQVHRRGFAQVDLLYIDSLYQQFWLDSVTYRHAIFRVADYNPHFEKYTPAARRAEEEMAQRADLVLYPSRALEDYVAELGARRRLLFPNGADFEHFAGPPMPAPPEYAAIRRPIAVYLGVIPEWFHFDWVARAARELPSVSFVLIGPERLARRRLGGLPNVHLLGCRDYAIVPAYLQHAQVGLMPFDAGNNPDAVKVLNPQKMYAYFACGLPVVSASWEEVRGLGSPARLCSTGEEFVRELRQALADPGGAETYRRYASRFSWRQRATTLIQALEELGAEAPAWRRPA
jgi:glycosyltransferase involved in cell wall biosynthesis